MQNHWLATLFLAVSTSPFAIVPAACAAELQDVSEIHKFVTPDSPAFTVLGLSPTEIQRPTTPQRLAVSLSSFVTETFDGVVPSGLAVEFAPYWLFPHESLTYSDITDTPRVFLRMLTVSLASGNAIAATDSTPGSLDLAVGFRTRILDGRGVDSRALDRLQDGLMAISVAQGQVAATTMTGMIGASEEEIQEAVQAAKDQAERAMAKRRADVRKEVGAIAASRGGALLDLAYAFSSRHEGRKLAEGSILNHSAWATFGYSWPSWDALAVGRGTWHRAGNTDSTSWDFGARAIWSKGAHAFSAEALVRATSSDQSGVDDRTLYRTAITFEQKIMDGTWLSATTGRDWEDEGALFSLAHLKWGLGKQAIPEP